MMTTTNPPTPQLTECENSHQPTDQPTATETDKERKARKAEEKKRKTAENKKKKYDADYEREAMEADLRQQMADMEAKFKRMMATELAKKDAEILELKKKPVRKPREPKPTEYWEGQVKTDDGWRFENKESAKLYGKSLKGDEKDDFMIDWDQTFAEKKEKKTGRVINKNTDRTKNGDQGCQIRVPKIAGGWKNGAEGCGRKFCALRGGYRICKQHEKTANDHMERYSNWKVEYGTHNGWMGGEELPKPIKNPNYVKASRGKKD